MPLRSTCWNEAPTSAPFDSCSVTAPLATTAKYLRISDQQSLSTSSPLDLLPRPVALEVKPKPPQPF